MRKSPQTGGGVRWQEERTPPLTLPHVDPFVGTRPFQRPRIRGNHNVPQRDGRNPTAEQRQV